MTLWVILAATTAMLLYNGWASSRLGPSGTVTETLVSTFANGTWWGKVLFIGFVGWFAHVLFAFLRR